MKTLAKSEGWKMSLPHKKIWADVAAGVFLVFLAFFFAMKSPLNPWTNGSSDIDSSVFKYVAFVMSEGGMPYKDAFDHKGPLLYVLNYIGNAISYYRGIWVVEVCSLLVVAISIYRICRLFCGPLYSCFLSAVVFSPLGQYFEGGNFTEEYAMPFIAMALFFFIDYFKNQRITIFRLILCGAAFGAVFMLRPNMIAVWIVFCIGVLVQSLWKDKKIPWNFLGYFLMGVVVVVLPLVIWLISKGAFSYFIQDYFLFNMEYSSSSGASNLYQKLISGLNWIGSSLCLVSIACIVYLIAQKQQLFFHVLYLISILFSIAMTAMSGQVYSHYGMVLIPLFAYPLAAVTKCATQDKKENSSLLAISMVFLLIAAPVWKVTGQDALNALKSPNKSIVISEDVKKVSDFIQSNTTPEDKIQVIGNYNFLYVYNRRQSASRYSYQEPVASISDKIRQEFLQDMETQLPKVVVVKDINNSFFMSLFPTIDQYEQVFVLSETMGVYQLKG